MIGLSITRSAMRLPVLRDGQQGHPIQQLNDESDPESNFAAGGNLAVMVRTGARVAALSGLLRAAGLHVLSDRPPAPRLADLDEVASASVIDLYHSFGGERSSVVLRPGAWDLALEGSLLVELDEELHFNRYRLATLDPDWTRRLPWRDAYVAHCERTERTCISAGSWGKRWTNPSCEAMFGAAGAPGQLEGPGAPRWKQRAVYDAIKDGYAVSHPGRVARVSVHDVIAGVSLGRALEGGRLPETESFTGFIRERTS
jgi:hypothetical protein